MFLRVWLVARREYLERIRTRGFVITTIMIPLIMAGFVGGSIFLGSRGSNEQTIAIASTDTQLALDLQTELNRRQQLTKGEEDSEPAQNPTSLTAHKNPPRLIVEVREADPGMRAELDHQLDTGELDGYLWITPATTPAGRPKFEFNPRSSDDALVRDQLANALDTVLLREQLTHRGIVAADAETMLLPVQVVALHRTHRDDHESAEISVSILFFIMYLVIMLYGMNVARSIIEEKTSRIFEVLLATIRPEAMMAGKILGVGSVGLTQVGIWLSAVLVLAGTSAAVHVGNNTFHVSLTATQVFFFLIYFILGYLFYSAIAAALGAMTNSEQELQQLNMFLMLPLLVCFVMLGTLLTTPDGTLSRVLALVPPFTPLLMYFRVSLGHPAAWEVILSIVLTTASIGGIICRQPHLSRRHPDVRQASQLARSPPLAEI
jgi:ABC-2 type transport system permease protein